jgi:hypothetical protein
MDQQIAKLNIEHFCRRLRTESDPVMRALLYFLLLREQKLLGAEFEGPAPVSHRVTRLSEWTTRH